MPTYRYEAQDLKGRPQSGQIAADGPEQAIARLAAGGLRSIRLVAAASEETGQARVEAQIVEGQIVDEIDAKPLSLAETVDLGALIAALAESNLPLDSGLKAAALELRRGRLSRVLLTISNQLQRGVPLGEALASQGPRFPAHLRGLVLAGLHSGRLASVLEEFVSLERRAALLRRQVALSLAYPLLLIAMLAALGVFFSAAVVPGMAKLFDDFEMDLPTQTVLLLSMSDGGPYALLGTLLAILAIWLLLWLSTDFAEMRSMLKATPLVGPIARWAGLARFARLLALLLENRLTMPDSLRLAGIGSRDGELSAACRRAAEQVEAGQSLRESLAGSPAFPKSLGPIADWGERARALPEALRTAAEMFEGRVQGQLVYLRMIVPPLTFLIVLWGAMFLVTALTAPMFSLIEKLT